MLYLFYRGVAYRKGTISYLFYRGMRITKEPSHIYFIRECISHRYHLIFILEGMHIAKYHLIFCIGGCISQRCQFIFILQPDAYRKGTISHIFYWLWISQRHFLIFSLRGDAYRKGTIPYLLLIYLLTYLILFVRKYT